MPKSVLNIVAPIILGSVALGITAMVDFTSRATAANAPYGFTDYLVELPNRAAIAVSDELPSQDMVSLLPPAPVGWVGRAMTEADYFTVTGLAPPVTEVDPAAVELQNALENNPVAGLLVAQQKRGFDNTTQTYVGPGQMIVYIAQFVPARTTNGLGGKQLGMMMDIMNMTEMPSDFASVKGVMFEASEIEGSQTARKLKAQLSRQVYLEIVSDAPDDVIIGFLDQIDLVALNAKLAEPLAGIGPEQPTLNAEEIAQAALIAEEEACIAENAANIERARAMATDFSGTTRRERRLLKDFAEGTVTTVQTAEAKYGPLSDIAPHIIAFLSLERWLGGAKAEDTAGNADGGIAHEPVLRPTVRRLSSGGQNGGGNGGCGVEIGAKTCRIVVEAAPGGY